MTPLRIVSGKAVSLPEASVDTDIIYPARFLLVLTKTGLGEYAFHDRLAKDPDFPVHAGMQESILIAGDNFGCGSSREQAPWALVDIGVRVIIAPSFGDIFYGNCLRNGLLPIRLPDETVQQLHEAANEGHDFTVSLIDKTIQVDGLGSAIPFDVPDDSRESLMNGWNETTRILEKHSDDIEAFEHKQRSEAPWLW